MAAYDDLDVKSIFVVGIVSIVITAVTVLAVQVIYYQMVQTQVTETAAASDYRRQNAILEQQQSEISNYGVDQQTGNIIIPINKAIELMVGDEKSDKESDRENDKENESNEET